MLKKILSYGFVEGVAKGLNKLIFLVLPLFLGTIGYGKIGLLFSLEVLLPIISVLGLERAVLRFYGEEKRLVFFKKTIFVATFYAHLAVFVILGIFLISGGRNFFGLSLFPDLFLVVLIVYFQSRNLLNFNMLRVNEEHKKYFNGRLFFQITKFLLVILLVYVLDSYLGYLLGALIAVVATSILFPVRDQEERATFDKGTFITLFLFSWPFIFHGISGNLLGNADKFILEHFMTLSDVGLYSFAYAIGSTMVFAYIGISVYLEPLIYKEKLEVNRKKLLKKYVFLATVFSMIAYVGISLISLYVLPHLYIEYYTVFSIIPLIALSYLIYPFYLTSNYRMIYERKSLKIAITSIITASINIALNVILIPRFGIYAAVITTAISYSIQAFVFILISNKFRITREFFEAIFLCLVICLGIYFTLPYYYIVLIMVPFLIYLYLNDRKSHILKE